MKNIFKKLTAYLCLGAVFLSCINGILIQEINAMYDEGNITTLQSNNTKMNSSSFLDSMTGSYDDLSNTGAYNYVNTGSLTYDFAFDPSTFNNIVLDLSYFTGAITPTGPENEPAYTGSFVFNSGSLSDSTSEAGMFDLNMDMTFSGGLDSFLSGTLDFSSMQNGFFGINLYGGNFDVPMPIEDCTITYEFLVDLDGSYLQGPSTPNSEILSATGASELAYSGTTYTVDYTLSGTTIGTGASVVTEITGGDFEAYFGEALTEGQSTGSLDIDITNIFTNYTGTTLEVTTFVYGNGKTYANDDTPDDEFWYNIDFIQAPIVSTGSLEVSVDNTDFETDENKHILGNTTSDFVASFEFTATGEPILINDLNVTAIGIDFANAVSEIILYDNDKTTEIARESVTANTTGFSNINHLIEEGTENIYVKVVARKIGKDEIGILSDDYSLRLQLLDAEGGQSNQSIDLPSITGDSLLFNVVPVDISAISFVSSYGGNMVNSSLTNGENNIGILAITSATSSNTNSVDGTSLKLELESLVSGISGSNLIYDTTGTTPGSITALTIEKINGSNSSQTVNKADGTILVNSTDLSNLGIDLFKNVTLGTDKEIDNGSTSYYLIKATFSGLDGNNDRSIQLQLTDINTTGISYSSNNTDDNDTYNDSDNIFSLRNGQTSIMGPTIASEYGGVVTPPVIGPGVILSATGSSELAYSGTTYTVDYTLSGATIGTGASIVSEITGGVYEAYYGEALTEGQSTGSLDIDTTNIFATYTGTTLEVTTFVYSNGNSYANDDIPDDEFSYTIDFIGDIGGGTEPGGDIGLMDTPLSLDFDNGGVGGTGDIVLSLTNELGMDIIGVLGVGIGFDSDFSFDINTVVLSEFTGALTGLSCSSIEEINDYDVKGIECTLDGSFDFPADGTLSLKVGTITNPSAAGNYFVDMVLVTSTQEEYFGTELTITDASDQTAPVLDELIVKSSNELVLKFDEAIDLGFSPSSPNGNIEISINGLDTYGFRDDRETNFKLFISTSDQTSGESYSYTISGIKDFNGNEAGDITGTFTGFDTTGKYIDYINPSNFVQGGSGVLVDIYGKNDLFSVDVSNILVNFGDGVTVNDIEKIDSDHITCNITIDENTYNGSRDLIINDGSTDYTLYNAVFIDKNYDNFLSFYEIYTDTFDGDAGKLYITFNEDMSSLTKDNFQVQKVYGTTAKTSVIDAFNTSNSGTLAVFDLSGMDTGVWYEIKFVGVDEIGTKEIDDYMTIGFDFFDPNTSSYDDKIAPPVVVDSFPYEGAYDMPVDNTGTGFKMEVYFDQELDEDTLTTTNIKLKDINNNSIPGTIDYEYVDGEYSKLEFKTTSQLNFSTNYYLSLSHNIKSVKSLGLVGNVPASEGEGHKVSFTTIADYSGYNLGDLDTSGIYMQDFYVVSTNPYPGAIDIPIDGRLQITFSDIIDTSTVSEDSVLLEKIDSNGDVLSRELYPIEFDNVYTPTTMYIALGQQNLAQDSSYRLTITNSLKSVKGQALDVPMYSIEFDTGNGSTADTPLNIDWDYNEQDLSRIEIGFSNIIDTETVNTNNIKLFNTNGTKIVINTKYNPDGNYIVVTPTTKLSENTDYQLIIGAGLKDIFANSISTANLINGFVSNSGNIEKTYSIGVIDDAYMSLFVEDFFATSNKIELKFNKNIGTPTSSSHYLIKYATNFDFLTDGMPENYISNNGVSLSLASANIKYDNIDYRVFIEGLDIPSSDAGKETIVEVSFVDVKDAVDSSNVFGDNKLYMPVFSDEIQDDFMADDMAMAMGANINGQNNTAGKTTLYFVDYPVSKQLSSGTIVEVVFPKQFGLSGAQFDSLSPINYLNGRVVNGQEKFSVSVDLVKNALIYTLSDAYIATLGEFDYIPTDIKGITNPTQVLDSGYIADITIKTSDGLVIDKFKSNPIYIKEAVSGDEAKTLTVQLKDKNGVDLTESDIIIHMHGPDGYEELTTDASGTATFVGKLNEYYGITIDSFVQKYNGVAIEDSGYLSEGKYYQVFLDDNKTIYIGLKAVNDATEMITISGNIEGLNQKEVTVWLAGPKGYFEKELGTLNSDDFAYSLSVPKNVGFVTVGIMPTMKNDFEMSANSEIENIDWQPSKPLNLNIADSDISNVDFEITAANTDFNLYVKDSTGKSIPNAHVFAYSPSGDMMGLYGDTDLNGLKTFKLTEGTYTYGAFIDGLPPIPEKQITVGSSGTYSGTLIAVISDLQISGKVLDGTNPISGANVYAYNQVTGEFLDTQTNSAGEYILYVGAGTWKVGGEVSNYGPLTEKTLTVTTESLINKNFSIDVSTLNSVSGYVKDSSTDPISGVGIIAEPNDGDYKKFAQVFTDDTGLFTFKLKNGTYTLRAFHPEYGDIGFINNVVVNDAPLTGKNFTLSTLRNVTVSFTGAGLPNDISTFEWMIDVFDNTNDVGFNKKIVGSSSYVFDKVPEGTYEIRVIIPGIGEVYENTSFVVDGDETVSVTINTEEKKVAVTGIVTDGTNPLKDAFVEIKNNEKGISIGEKTGSGGIFSIDVKAGNYTVIIKKPSYQNSEPIDITVTDTGYDLGTRTLTSITSLSDTITVSGTVSSSSGSIDLGNNAFINLQGVNDDGTLNNFWFGNTIDGDSEYSFEIPNNYKWKAIVVADGHTDAEYEFGTLTSDTTKAFELTYVGQITEPKSTPLTPSKGGVISDAGSGIKVVLPGAALGNGANPGKIKTKVTKKVPTVPGFKPIGGTAKQITAFNSKGNSITNLNSDATLEFTYTSTEILATKSTITIDEVRNLQVHYYDNTANSWIALPTVVSFSGSVDIDNHPTGSDLFSTVLDGAVIDINLKATTDHFTDFAPGVSSSVSSAEATTTIVSVSSSGGGGGSSSSSSVSTESSDDTSDDESIDSGEEDSENQEETEENLEEGEEDNDDVNLVNEALNTLGEGKKISEQNKEVFKKISVSDITKNVEFKSEVFKNAVPKIGEVFEQFDNKFVSVDGINDEGEELKQNYREEYANLLLVLKGIEEAKENGNSEELKNIREEGREIAKNILLLVKERNRLMESYGNLELKKYGEESVYKMDYKFENQALDSLEDAFDKQIDKKLKDDDENVQLIIANRNELFMAIYEIVEAKKNGESNENISTLRTKAREVYKEFVSNMQ